MALFQESAIRLDRKPLIAKRLIKFASLMALSILCGLTPDTLLLSARDTQPEAFDEAYDRMREMAEAGGGLFYEVNRLEDLAGAYERVVTDLGTVYSLAYEPVNKTRDGKWRAIRIRVNRTNAVARGKRGYYAN